MEQGGAKQFNERSIVGGVTPRMHQADTSQAKQAAMKEKEVKGQMPDTKQQAGLPIKVEQTQKANKQ